MLQKKKIAKFQMGYLSYISLKHHRTFRDKVEIFMVPVFSGETYRDIRIVLKKENSHVITLLMFY